MPSAVLTPEEILREVGAVLDGHFVLASGLHSPSYVNKDAIYPHTVATAKLCGTIGQHFLGQEPEVVIAPAVGGVILSQWVAHYLTTKLGREILSLYADKAEDGFRVGRGYDRFIPERRVLVVEDVLTTGGSVQKVIEATRKKGGKVIGVGVLCNRGGLTAQSLNVPDLYGLVTVDLVTYEADNCPLCRDGVPINTEVGKGREFLDKRQTA